MPESVGIDSKHLMYPKAWGLPALREALAGYYNRAYGCELAPENVMVFAGGRPAIIASLLFLDPDVTVRIASTEYTPYYDILEGLGKRYELVESSVENGFRPSVDDYLAGNGRSMIVMSNPCNPTGITRDGEDLARLVAAAESGRTGLLVDEAYELFHDPPVSALQHVKNIDESDLLVIGAATKGLQAPGIRVGWLIGSREHVEILSNFSSFGMGGVSHPSQLYALELLREERVALSRKAIPDFYGMQRARYGEAFERLGLDIHSGDGGFYHWCRLPGGMTAADLNDRLYPMGAAVLKGTDCDMARRGAESPLASFFRFSFGPLAPESFEEDVSLMERALG